MVTIDDFKAEYPDIRQDFTVDQKWDQYTDEEHQVWKTLYKRQMEVLPGRVTPEFIEGLEVLKLDAEGIPNFDRMNEDLEKLTGWRVFAVPGLVPDDVFFEHLANRRFVAGRFIRRADQLDYLEEPDIFHDVFGHVPLLANPIFADYMEAYGKGGQRAMRYDALKNLARLYWYTVEFGLIKQPEGMRIYGAGIVSSATESVFSLEDDSPNRVHFDLVRLMRTNYRIDDFQQTYFVIDSFNELFGATVGRDFGPIYEQIKAMPELQPEDITDTDIVHGRGSQAYARGKQAKAG